MNDMTPPDSHAEVASVLSRQAQRLHDEVVRDIRATRERLLAEIDAAGKVAGVVGGAMRREVDERRLAFAVGILLGLFAGAAGSAAVWALL